jgi:hypothetical protein
LWGYGGRNRKAEVSKKQAALRPSLISGGKASEMGVIGVDTSPGELLCCAWEVGCNVWSVADFELGGGFRPIPTLGVAVFFPWFYLSLVSLGRSDGGGRVLFFGIKSGIFLAIV